jgi:hypothetical protein
MPAGPQKYEIAGLEALLRRAARAGRLPPALNLTTPSLWLVALLDGAISRVSLEPETDLAKALEALANTLRWRFTTGPGQSGTRKRPLWR